MTRRDDLRKKALANLQEFEVLMLDGHFDYGNGYHGRVYLNPHRIFRQPSLIWRLGQDLIDVLPDDVMGAAEVVAGPGAGRRAAGPHDRRTPRQPPQPEPAADELRAPLAERRRHAPLLPIGRRRQARPRWPTTSATPGRRSNARKRSSRKLVEPSSRTCEIYDRLEAIVNLGVPNFALAEYKAPENFAVSECPMCRAGMRHRRRSSRTAVPPQRPGAADALRDALDSLYAGFNHPESALDPDPDRQTVRTHGRPGNRRVRRRRTRLWPRGVGHGVRRGGLSRPRSRTGVLCAPVRSRRVTARRSCLSCIAGRGARISSRSCGSCGASSTSTGRSNGPSRPVWIPHRRTSDPRSTPSPARARRVDLRPAYGRRVPARPGASISSPNRPPAPPASGSTCFSAG